VSQAARRVTPRRVAAFWGRYASTVPVAAGLVQAKPVATGPASPARGPTYVCGISLAEFQVDFETR
jgi:hypothetical protein